MVSIENLFFSWDHFKRGKQKKEDIQYIERYLENFIFDLHDDLTSLRYQHAPYEYFHIAEPKERSISKASVRDRLVHQVVYSTLTKLFDKTFIFRSLSCRLGKGTHMGIEQLQKSLRKVSLNGTRHCFALKMDIRRFFDSIDHKILKTLIRKKVKDDQLMQLIDIIIDSFSLHQLGQREVGLPLGNVTSQLFGNIYLHELDTFVKQELRQKHYLRYCDDFIMIDHRELELDRLVELIRYFLKQKLLLDLHPRKVTLNNVHQGIDFLGYILFLNHRLVRTRTKRRMKRRLEENYINYLNGKVESSHMDQCLQSYLGILSHANQHDLTQALKNSYWIREPKGDERL